MDIKVMLGPRVRLLACWMQGRTRERRSGNRSAPQYRVIIEDTSIGDYRCSFRHDKGQGNESSEASHVALRVAPTQRPDAPRAIGNSWDPVQAQPNEDYLPT